MNDDYLSGASSQLRSFLGGVKQRQRSPFDAATPESASANVNGGMQYLRTNFDPRWKQGSLDLARTFGNDAGAAEAASTASYGSIASRNDPNQFGSIASRQFPDAFGPTGSQNPSYKADQAADEQSRQQNDALTSAHQTADLHAQYTASYLAPLFQNLMQGMQRRSLSSDPTSVLSTPTGKDNGN